MTDADLDRSYTALCRALGEVGEGQAPLFLSMLCLAWMARADSAEGVVADVERVLRLCQGQGRGPQ